MNIYVHKLFGKWKWIFGPTGDDSRIPTFPCAIVCKFRPCQIMNVLGCLLLPNRSINIASRSHLPGITDLPRFCSVIRLKKIGWMLTRWIACWILSIFWGPTSRQETPARAHWGFSRCTDWKFYTCLLLNSPNGSVIAPFHHFPSGLMTLKTTCFGNRLHPSRDVNSAKNGYDHISMSFIFSHPPSFLLFCFLMEQH